MSVTTDTITAAELADRAAEYPCLIGRNLLEIAYKQDATQLVTNEVGDLATGDASATGFDRRRLTQRYKHRLWKGNSTGTAWYIVIDTGTDLQWTDALVVGPDHNLSGVDITVEADSTTPAVPWTGATSVFSETLAADSNVFLHASTMYKARYWRITLSSVSTFTPEATSFWLGKAIQFPVAPLLASGTPNSYRGSAIEHRTAGGIPTRYVEHGALMERSLSFLVDQHHEGTFFSDSERGFDDFFKNANALNGGHAHFWYVDEPTADPGGTAKLVRLGSPSYRPMLRRRGSGDSGLTAISLELQEVGGSVG